MSTLSPNSSPLLTPYSGSTQIRYGMVTPTSSPREGPLNDLDVACTKTSTGSNAANVLTTTVHLTLPVYDKTTAPLCMLSSSAPQRRRTANWQSLQDEAERRPTVKYAKTKSAPAIKKKASTRKLTTKVASSQPRVSLCATHPSQYQVQLFGQPTPAAVSTSVPHESTMSLTDELCSPSQQSRKYRAETVIDPTLGTAITSRGPPAWPQAMGLNNRDVGRSGYYTVSPTFMVGLPFGGTIETAHIYHR